MLPLLAPGVHFIAVVSASGRPGVAAGPLVMAGGTAAPTVQERENGWQEADRAMRRRARAF